MDFELTSYVIGMFATIAFAITAVIAVQHDKAIDLMGAVVLGVITAIGGGTIRDLILDVPVFWGKDLSYVWIAFFSSIAAFFFKSRFEEFKLDQALVYLDGLGAVLFGVQACEKVWNAGFGLPVAPVLLGTVSAIGGGLTRDVLAGRRTLLVKSDELYASPVLLATTAFTLVLAYMPKHRVVGSIVIIVLAFGFRAAAIHWHLGMPSAVRSTPDKTSQ